MINKNVLQEIRSTFVEMKQLLAEQLPKNIDKGSLHKILGYDEDTNLAEVSKEEFIKRCKRQINSGKVTYKELIGKLNWQATMNKSNNPEFSKRLRSIMDELKEWWESKKEKED